MLTLVISVLFQLSQSVDQFDWLSRSYYGAHNAYHQRTTAALVDDENSPPVEVFVPVNHEDYPSLTDLLDAGVCALEIDLYPSGEADDYSVHHVDYFDAGSSCSSLSVCLGEISDWLGSKRGDYSRDPLCPIMINLELKGWKNGLWDDENLLDLDHLVKHSMDKHILYTPEDHKAKSWKPWGDWLADEEDENEYKIKPWNAIITVANSIISTAYPGAETQSDPSDGDKDEQYEQNSVLFARCGAPTEKRFCVILGNPVGQEDLIGHYPFRRYINKQQLQLTDWKTSLGPDGNQYITNIPTSIKNAMLDQMDVSLMPELDWVTARVIFDMMGIGSDNIEDMINYIGLPVDWWNAWMIFSYVDSTDDYGSYAGNGNGLIDAQEVGNFAFYSFDHDLTTGGTVMWIIANYGLIPGDAPHIVIDKQSFNNPFILAAAAQLFSDPQFSGIIPVVPLDPVNDLKGEVCEAVTDGITYISSPYPYAINSNWEYTVADYIDGILCT